LPDQSSEAAPRQVVEVEFTDMAYGGDAVGRLPGENLAVFAWPAIKGERARVEIVEARKNLLRGRVTGVIEPAPARVEPPCPYFGPCGGCQWQHIDYPAQVGFKHDILRSQLVRMAGISDPDTVLRPPIPSPRDYGYRNTSHFALEPASRSLGYFTRDSHTVVAVDLCPISNAGINAAVPIVNAMLSGAAGGEEPGPQGKGMMRVWQVSVRSSEQTGHTVVVFHSRAESASRPRPHRGQRRAHSPARPEEGPSLQPEAASNPDVPLSRREVRRAVSNLHRGADGGVEAAPLALSVVEVMEDGTVNMLGATREAASLASDAEAEALAGSSLGQGLTRAAAGESGPPLGAWLEKLAARYYWIAPEAFFQVNTLAAEHLLAEAAAHVPARLDLLVDAHAGVGTFGMALASRAARVVCFETGAAAIASGRWTALASRAANVEFRHGRAEALLARLPGSERPDLVLLDPPRSGCHPDLLAEIARRSIPRILYVSCDPSTLARDIKILSPHYTLTSARLIDMFPQTFHIETVAVLDIRA
jgi:23S rRNA (uracil1939-C5)-methyltransferase